MSELTAGGSDFETTYRIVFKRNLGNFENVDIEVGLKQAGHGNKADIDRAHARNRKWVEDALADAVQEVTAALKGE